MCRALDARGRRSAGVYRSAALPLCVQAGGALGGERVDGASYDSAAVAAPHEEPHDEPRVARVVVTAQGGDGQHAGRTAADAAADAGAGAGAAVVVAVAGM